MIITYLYLFACNHRLEMLMRLAMKFALTVMENKYETHTAKLAIIMYILIGNTNKF